MLSLPVSSHGYIEASQRQEPAFTVEIDPNPEGITLHVRKPSPTAWLIRIDIEPCWEGDPQTVVFRCRCEGMLLYPVNISTIISPLAREQRLKRESLGGRLPERSSNAVCHWRNSVPGCAYLQRMFEASQEKSF